MDPGLERTVWLIERRKLFSAMVKMYVVMRQKSASYVN